VFVCVGGVLSACVRVRGRWVGQCACVYLCTYGGNIYVRSGGWVRVRIVACVHTQAPLWGSETTPAASADDLQMLRLLVMPGDIIIARLSVAPPKPTFACAANGPWVQVIVTDVNDNSPVFDEADGPPSFAVTENSPAGALVGKVSAHDADAGSNGIVMYSIDGGACPSIVPGPCVAVMCRPSSRNSILPACLHVGMLP